MPPNKLKPADCLPKAEVFAPKDDLESMLMYGISGMEFQATDARPGSVEKVAVLSYRVERGLPLWHTDDRLDLEGINDYKESVDPWGIPEFVYDDAEYEMEQLLPEHLR